MKHVIFTILSVLLMSCDGETQPRTKTIDTPEGQITTTVKTVEPTPQRVELAPPADLERFRLSSAQAKRFAATYVANGSALDLKVLDEAFRRWQQQSSSAFTREQVVELLGAALGEKLVADLDMEWVVVSDQLGTDYAVRSKTSEVMAFPFSSVQKRIDKNEYDFMFGVYHSVRSMLEGGDYPSRDKAHDD